MKIIMAYFRTKIIPLIILVVLSQLYFACGVQLVATYDPIAVNDIIQAYQEVDGFYQKLINTTENKREFKTFSTDYDKIETDLRILVLKNSARTLNKESTQIAKNILGLWQKYKQAHKETNSYDSDQLVIHRNRFFENFEAMTIAENAKPREKEK